MIFNKCSQCGKSINRYTFKSLKSGLRVKGGFYTHVCPHCGTTYTPSVMALLVILLILSYYGDDVLGIYDNWLAIILLFPVITIISIMYILPLSVFCKKTS